MLNDLQKTKLIPEAILNYMTVNNVSKAELSRVSKVETTKMNYICKGETVVPNQNGGTEIKDKYYIAICNIIGFQLEDQKKWRHFNTDNFKAIISQIKEIRENKDRGTVDGDTGAGKSYGCEMYQKRFPHNTFLVKCDPIENSKEFARSLAEVVRVEDHGTAGAIIKRVCNKLLSLDDVLLIIDESEHIKSKSGYINIIKSLADRLENKVSLVLCGMDINDILQKASDKHKQNFRQSARRFSNRMKCYEDISADVKKIATELGFNAHCANWLALRMKNFGELKVIVTAALQESEKSQEPITITLLESLYQC